MRRSHPLPDFSVEQKLLAEGWARVCGVDEVGRGPLAGPVVAAAVLFEPNQLPEQLDDSKKLSANQRQKLAPIIKQRARAWCVALATVAEIDLLNIRQAALLAMSRAVAGLTAPPDYILVDGRDSSLPHTILPTQAIIRGDQTVLSIAAASILAKVFRDSLMQELAVQFPGYGWEQNVGYPTRSHIQALRELGITPHHRKTFGPVRALLESGGKD